jgi:hypothetical protein
VGVELTSNISLTHSLSQSLLSGVHWIFAQVWIQEISLSHFFAASFAHTFEGKTLG